MTDQLHDENTDEATNEPGINRRRMFIAGAGLAGAAALTKAGTASAADDDPVLVGNPDNETDDGATVITNTNNTATSPGTAGQEAVTGVLTGTDNGSHAIKGVTQGLGHSVAGDTPAGTANAVAATWGRHGGMGAGVGGVNTATDVDIAGPARGVEGVVTDATNGSHAVFGLTNGGGHSVAGDTPADAPNTVAATWGRHGGMGAGVGGVNTATDVDIAGPARGVEGVVTDATNGSHAVFGLTNGGGHAVAGDVPADAPNTVAATWGRHMGAGAGIGGISVGGYGGEFVGGKAHVRLIQVDNADPAVAEDDQVTGPPTDDAHSIGELFADGAGNLYYHQGGDAGFTKLTNQTTLLPDIQRAYDSRAGEVPANSNKGRHTAGETREIDLTEFTDMPAGASGAIINVTVADTLGNGYALVFNGDSATDPTPVGSSVNWLGSGMFVANGITVATGADGTVNVFTLEETDVIIDVVGYIS